MADNCYFGLLKHICNHTYHLIYQHKLCFLPTEGIFVFRKILKMEPPPLPWRNSPSSGKGPHYPGFTITIRYTTLGKTPLDEWFARRRELYLKTDIHVPGGIRTRNPRKRAATDAYWDRPELNLLFP